MASRTLSFAKTVAPLTQDEEEQQALLNGEITEVVMAFPSGPQQTVDVRVIYIANKKPVEFVVPSREDSFIALDNATPHYKISHPVTREGRIRVEWWNHASANSYEVPVQVTVEEKL